MKLWKSLFSLLSLVVILLASNSSTGYAKYTYDESQQAGQTPLLCITSAPNTAAFPNITLNFRMVDANFSPIVPAETELRFAENNQTPVPLASGIQRDPNGVGINYYIIIDKGNRTVQTSVRSVLQTFAAYFNEATDKVQIYTDEKNGAQLYFPGKGFNTLTQAISDFPVENDTRPRQVMQSFYKVLEDIEANPDACQNMRVIIMIMGDEAILKDEVLSVAQRTKSSFTKLAIFHLGGASSGSFQSRDIYNDLANRAGGIYQQVISLDNDTRPVLDQLALYKQVFSVAYRTNYGLSGVHNIGATYLNENILVQGQTAYQVEVLPPTVSLEGETVIARLAQKVTESGEYIYDINELPYIARVDWGDSYPRNITNASVILKEGNTENETAGTLTLKDENAYEINWDFSAINLSGEHKLYLSVKVTDEFGIQSTSAPLEISLTNNVETLGSPVLMWGLYILGAIVIVLIVLMVFMWRRMLSFAQQGGAVIGKIADEIRRTIVGGTRRGKPLATLKILDGPPNMVGQELKVYTESVKLGRNPQLADMTFYSPNVSTSVSGLHARLEKMNGAWRIVALSQSGSETFIDDQPIPFNEPVSLGSGQKIRLGYFAQQPVVLEFQSEVSEFSESRITSVEHTDVDYSRKTNVKIDPNETQTEQQGFFGKPNKKVSAPKKQSSENSDSVFDEFR